ncbi:MAG: VCBS repeat-containing protein [Phycisphaerales bacterium]|nr:MAG: VCBS repeat-containing protein [Phycisphaerales bacterium]
MKSVVFKRLALAVAALVIVLGCSSVLNHVNEEASQGTDALSSDVSEDTTATSGFEAIDSEFSDAPVSPGGTGGVIQIVEDDIDLPGEETRSFFTAFQIDPVAEDSAGPKFVVAEDIDQDGLLDLVSAWNQSQPIQLHLQRRDADNNISFRTITIAGTTPVAVVAGLEVGQINDDGWLDIVVLCKATALMTLCPPKVEGQDPSFISNLDGAILVYFSPGNDTQIPDGDAWTEMELINPLVQDPWIHDQFPGIQNVEFDESKTSPEWAGFTSLVVTNIDGIEGDDILVALNPGECENLGQKPPTNTVDLWNNPGPGFAEMSQFWGAPPPSGQSRNVPITLIGDAPQVKDLEVLDIDSDGDLDVVATYTNAISANVRWVRNPLVAHNPGGSDGPDAVIDGVDAGWWYFASEWEQRPIGQIDTGADMMTIGDIDRDGFNDIVVRSTFGQIVQWFRQPNPLQIAPEFPPNDAVPDRFNFPWPVFTLTEFNDLEPGAVALGDVTGDDVPELMIASQGAVFWYDSSLADSVYDAWTPNTIIQDSPIESGDPSQAGFITPGAGVGVDTVDVTTSINALLVVDLDADGRNDIVGTLDRRSGAGLSDDRLVWYRNVRRDDDDMDNGG